MTHPPRNKEPSGSAQVLICDWCKYTLLHDVKEWRGLKFHASCYKYGKKGWNERMILYPERDWTDKAGGVQISLEEEQRRIQILGEKGRVDGRVDGDDEGTSREARDAT